MRLNPGASEVEGADVVVDVDEEVVVGDVVGEPDDVDVVSTYKGVGTVGTVGTVGCVGDSGTTPTLCN